jgi:hypothetical protein
MVSTCANKLLPTDRLETALAAPFLGQERAWVQGLADALREMEQALVGHAADAESPDGVFAEVDQTRRGLARRAEGLGAEITELLEETVVLEEWALRAAEPDELAPESAARLAPLSERVVELIAAIRQLVDGETDVVMESVNMDLGAGD